MIGSTNAGIGIDDSSIDSKLNYFKETYVTPITTTDTSSAGLTSSNNITLAKEEVETVCNQYTDSHISNFYIKPTTGIPSTDLNSAVNASLAAADAAIPNPATKSDKQALIYNATSGKWEAGTIGGFVVQTSAPSNHNVLWIDTTANTGGLKYWNESDWVGVPVCYS